MRTLNLLAIATAALTLSACQRCLPPDCVEKSYIHRYGVVVEHDYWQSSGCNGQVVSTLRDGVILTQTFDNGALHGETTYSFPHSPVVQKRETYAHDQLISQTTYSLAGLPLTTTEYSTPARYTVTQWYEHGHPRGIEKFDRDMLIEGEYFNNQNQKDSWVCNGNGERYSRDCHGFLLTVDTFRGGELAYTTSYHANGTPKEITPFEKGQVHGERKTFYPAGDPMTIEHWHHGLQHGTTVIFQNGEKYAEVPYIASKKCGIERRFRDGSIVTQEISWDENRMHGPTYTYLGDSVQTDWFFRGRMTSRSNFESYQPQKKRPMAVPSHQTREAQANIAPY